MFWLRKFYGPVFAPANDGGAVDDTDDATDDSADDAADADDDAGEDADDSADDAADADDDAGEDADEPPPSRKESRNAVQARENRELREAKARLEGEVAALKRPAQSVDDNAAKQARETKLALMDGPEKTAFLAQEEAAAARKDVQRLGLQMQDTLDKSAYDAKAATNPIYAKHQAAIESYRASEFAAGRIPPNREFLLKLKLGDDALKPQAKKKSQAEKRAAADRVDAAKGTPQSARSDTGVKTGKNDPDSLEAITARIHAEERRRGVRQ